MQVYLVLLFVTVLTTISFVVFTIFIYVVLKSQFRERLLRKKAQSMAIFLREASNFFTDSETASFLEEIITYYKISGESGQKKVELASENLSYRIKDIVGEIESLLKTAKRLFELDVLQERLRGIMILFFVLAFPALLIEIIVLFNSQIAPTVLFYLIGVVTALVGYTITSVIYLLRFIRRE
ncbi:hypothetical protein HS7_15900 [Sulfolobales archaeon HS-7]|nr:hypothetical protein HS7_15900 [Sulfolobales archaeon HS-7]